MVRVEIAGAITMEESEDFFVRMAERNAEGRAPVIMIWDSTESKMPSMDVIKRWLAWLDENQETTKQNCLALIHVIPSAAVRGVLKFMNRVSPPPVETHLVRRRDEAESLACERLVDMGLTTREVYQADREKLAG